MTKESIPLLAEAFVNEKQFAMNVSPASGKNNADVSMRSSSGKTAREISIEHAKWERYIQEMAPFYTNLVSSYMEVLSKHQNVFGPEDVTILTKFAHFFNPVTR